MQLDRTHVVIRLRTLSEIGDLAMVMIRRYPSSLLIGFAIGAAPWILANALLLSWIPIREADYGLEDQEAVTEVTRYLVWMAVLVFIQAPIAGVLTTLYLGQAVFEHRPTWNSIVNQAKRQMKRWLWVLGMKRLAIPTMIFLAFRWGYPRDALSDAFVPLVIALLVAGFRSTRPFVPEILLLEQCPLSGNPDQVITISRRARSLHSPMSGDLTGRFISVSFIYGGLLLSVFATLLWCRGIAVGQWNLMDLTVLLLLYPLALWTIAAISVIVRLLNYLDTRIRLEGWEVELAVRAEAMRQFGDDLSNRVRPVSGATPHGGTTPPSESIPQAVEVVSGETNSKEVVTAKLVSGEVKR